MTADVYSGERFVATIESASMTGLKRCASKLCNSRYNVVDRMVVTLGTSTVTFYRINEKSPDNTIVWGQWR